MIRLIVLLAMFTAPILSEDPTPEEPVFETPTIEGCTDERAVNYIESHENLKVISDGSCVYLEGCLDPDAANYADFGDLYAKSDGSCYYLVCTQDDYGIESCVESSTNPNKKHTDKPVKKSDYQYHDPLLEIFTPLDDGQPIKISDLQ